MMSRPDAFNSVASAVIAIVGEGLTRARRSARSGMRRLQVYGSRAGTLMPAALVGKSLGEVCSRSTRTREEPAAAGRPGNTRSGGEAQRKPFQRTDGEIRERLRLEGVAIPADLVDRLYGCCETATESVHQRRVVAAAARDQPFARRMRKMASRCFSGGGRDLGQSGRSVFERQLDRHEISELVPVQRFWR